MTKRSVLIPLDGTEFSRQIFQEVAKFLSPADNKLVLLRVSHAPSGMVGKPTRPASAEVPVPMYESARDAELTFHPVYASQEWDSTLTALKDELQADQARLEVLGYSVETAVRFGNPAHEIISYVEDEDVDIVAMTTHGRSGLSRVISGSVAEEVLRKVSVPLLVLRSAELSAPEFAEGALAMSGVVANGHALRG